MRILHINKYYFLKGGAERYMLNLMEIQKETGHEVAIFAMEDPRNLSTRWSAYFAEPVETKYQVASSKYQLLRSAIRFIYNREAQRKTADLLDAFQPDIVHLHNYYHQLSTSILKPIRQRNIPVVQTVHDYHLIDPTYKLFANGKIFEDTKSGRDWKIIPERCIQNSYLASTLEAIESWYSRRVGGSWSIPDRFIAPSEFVRKKCIEFGVPAERMTTLYYTFQRDPSFWLDQNPTDPGRGQDDNAVGSLAAARDDAVDCHVGPMDIGHPRNDTDSSIEYQVSSIPILYVGRLDDEKGVDVLLRAMQQLPHIHLDIVGDGPTRQKFQQLAQNLHLTNVTFAGWKSKEEIEESYQRCAFLVVPSIWYEIFGLVILEAAQWSKPAIASAIGGIPEVIENGKQGLLVPAGNVDRLAQRIGWLAEHPNEQKRMGENTYKGLGRFDSKKHWGELEKMYEEVRTKKQKV